MAGPLWSHHRAASAVGTWDPGCNECWMRLALYVLEARGCCVYAQHSLCSLSSPLVKTHKHASSRSVSALDGIELYVNDTLALSATSSEVRAACEWARTFQGWPKDRCMAIDPNVGLGITNVDNTLAMWYGTNDGKPVISRGYMQATGNSFDKRVRGFALYNFTWRGGVVSGGVGGGGMGGRRGGGRGGGGRGRRGGRREMKRRQRGGGKAGSGRWEAEKWEEGRERRERERCGHEDAFPTPYPIPRGHPIYYSIHPFSLQPQPLTMSQADSTNQTCNSGALRPVDTVEWKALVASEAMTMIASTQTSIITFSVVAVLAAVLTLVASYFIHLAGKEREGRQVRVHVPL